MAELFKFDELRLKTEVQLLRLIHNELDRGLRSARHALTSTHSEAVAAEWNLRAQRACAEASRLIPLALEMSVHERSLVKSKLEYLRALLRTPPANISGSAAAEDEIAVLASVS